MFKKILLVSTVALSISSAAFAGGALDVAPVAPDMPLANAAITTDAGVYFGIMGGYGDTGWKALENSFFKYGDDTGWAAGAYLGYDFNRYMAAQMEYVYFGNKVNNTATFLPATMNVTIQTQAFDLVGKLKAPVADNIILYAKAGVGYLMSDNKPSDDLKQSDPFFKNDNLNVVNLVYGLGFDYYFTPNFIIGLSWTRFNGEPKFGDVTVDHPFTKYQPYADFYSVNLGYKINM